MQPECPMCQMWKQRGAKFCGNCGRSLSDVPTIIVSDRPTATVYAAGTDPEKKGPHTPSILRLSVIICVMVVTLIVANNTILSVAFFDRIVDDCSVLRFSFSLSYGFGDIVLFKYHGMGTAIALALCLIVEGLFLAYALLRFFKALNREKTQADGLCVEHTGLSAASSGLAVSLILSVILLSITAASGSAADSSWMSKYTDLQMIFMLTKAGLEEEIILRLVWIGIPMMIIALAVNKDRRSWQYLMGGFGMSKVAIILILFSSILFGLAHLDGWGWGKVPSATIGGLIFGYLYVEYGLYAAVLAHTANDTMTTLLYSFGQGVEVLAMLLLLLLGFVILIYWVLKISGLKNKVEDMPLFPGKLETNLLEQWGRH